MSDQELLMHFCKVCGKMFSNGRSLGGHMRSHLSSLSSFQDFINNQGEEEEEASRRSLYGHLKCHQEDQESQSDSEASEVVVTKKRKRKKRRRVRRVAEITSDHSLSVSESEKEDGALSLMMLSRDYSSIKQHSENDIIGSELGVKINLKRKRTKQFDSDSNCSGKAKRYKCVTCGKVFNSYQALGGHRTSHRKSDAYLSSLGPNSPEETVYRRMRNDHECPICRRVFSSGQALGGHKRSHLVSIDLNLPATEQ